MICALVFLAIVGAIQLFARNTGSMFDRVGDAIGGAIT